MSNHKLVTRSSFVNYCTNARKIAYENVLQYVNDFEGHSRSSEMARFDRPYITSLPVTGL